VVSERERESAVRITVGAAAGARILGSLLFGIDTFDAVAFLGAPVVLALVALASSYLPARRATRVDPIAALRSE
jgi:ABC-type lipoprotein release transport system permease subunit